MSEEETLSYNETTEAVRNLVFALHPWPISNERAYAIVHKHLGDLELGIRIYRREAHEYEVKLQKIQMIVMNEALSDPGGAFEEIVEVLREGA